MLISLMLLIALWIIIGIYVFVKDIALILSNEEKYEIYFLIMFLTFIFYLIFGTLILLNHIGFKRLFCILTFGHNLQTYYGYGCSMEDDFLYCNKCGHIPTNQQRYHNVPDNLK